MIENFLVLFDWVEKVVKLPNDGSAKMFESQTVLNVTSYISRISFEIEMIYPYFSSELNTIKNALFTNNLFLNSFQFGKLLVIMESIKYDLDSGKNLDFWKYIHPSIVEVSQKLFTDNHFSNAISDAFIEICSRIRKVRIELDGKEFPSEVNMIRHTFGAENPVIKFCDTTSMNGKNIQSGYTNILVGVIEAIRNTKAHDNIKISKEDAVRKLMLASLLMYKIDEALEFQTNIVQNST